MEEWKEYRLNTVCHLSAGGDAPHNAVKKSTTEMTIPIYSNGEQERGLYGYTDSYKIEAPAVTISARGNIGYVCYRKENFVPIVRLITAKANEQILSNEFLYYCLCNTHIWGDGSVQKQLTVPMISEYTLRIPPLHIQDKIVTVLKSLDDKIEVNRQINDNFYYVFFEIMLIWLVISLENDNLEHQGQALFKSWFVDFEPFKDGEFEETEIGLIPKGWLTGSLEDITTQKIERVGERDDVKVLSPVTTGQLMLSEEYFTKQVFSDSIAKYKVVKAGDFAYNPARVNIGSLGRNNYEFDGCVSPVYVVFSCKDGYAHMFDLYRKTEKFKTEVSLRAIGGVRQSLNYKDFAFIQCIVPPLHIVERFNGIYDHLLVMQKHTEEENDRLASLRDTLLPKLMSGELNLDKVNV